MPSFAKKGSVGMLWANQSGQKRRGLWAPVREEIAEFPGKNPPVQTGTGKNFDGFLYTELIASQLPALAAGDFFH